RRTAESPRRVRRAADTVGRRGERQGPHTQARARAWWSQFRWRRRLPARTEGDSTHSGRRDPRAQPARRLFYSRRPREWAPRLGTPGLAGPAEGRPLVIPAGRGPRWSRRSTTNRPTARDTSIVVRKPSRRRPSASDKARRNSVSKSTRGASPALPEL